MAGSIKILGIAFYSTRSMLTRWFLSSRIVSITAVTTSGARPWGELKGGRYRMALP